jgi:hypothetical protein
MISRLTFLLPILSLRTRRTLMGNKDFLAFAIFANVVEFASRAHTNVWIYRLAGVSIHRNSHERWPVEPFAHRDSDGSGKAELLDPVVLWSSRCSGLCSNPGL